MVTFVLRPGSRSPQKRVIAVDDQDILIVWSTLDDCEKGEIYLSRRLGSVTSIPIRSRLIPLAASALEKRRIEVIAIVCRNIHASSIRMLERCMLTFVITRIRSANLRRVGEEASVYADTQGQSTSHSILP